MAGLGIKARHAAVVLLLILLFTGCSNGDRRETLAVRPEVVVKEGWSL